MADQSEVSKALPGDTKVDISSIMSRISQLEREKNQLQEQVTNKESQLSKMTEAKKAEMQKVMDTMISNWLEQLKQNQQMTSEKVEDFEKGLHKVINATADDSGVWQVVCSASAMHASNVSELEQMRIQKEDLEKKLSGGSFSSINDRADIGNTIGNKRKAEENAEMPTRDVPDIWDEFIGQYKYN